MREKSFETISLKTFISHPLEKNLSPIDKSIFSLFFRFFFRENRCKRVELNRRREIRDVKFFTHQKNQDR